MLDEAEIIRAWLQANEAVNRGDITALSSLVADDITLVANDLTPIASSRDQFISSVAAAYSEGGQIGQDIVSISARANLLTVHFVNKFADGSTRPGAGVLFFGDDGKVIAIRAIVPQGSAMPPASV
jgi:hypothetical protein